MQIQRLRSVGPSPELVTDPSETGEESKIGGLTYGQMSIIGRRREMDDAVKVVPPWSLAGEYSFFAAYDGKGGAELAGKCSDRLYNCVKKHVETTKEKEVMDWGKIMLECYSNMEGSDAAAAADAAVVVVLLGKEEIVVASCGDSRAVLCRCGDPLPLSTNYKADREEENERLDAAGGRVISWEDDHNPISHVTSKPEVIMMRRMESDDFLIIATDGLWEVVSNEIACEVVKKCLTGALRRLPSEESGASEAAATLAELAIAKGSKDNISVIVVLTK